MSFLRLVLIIIGIYLTYKFIFDFVIPIYRTSRKMQEQFKAMQERMNQNMNGRPDQPTAKPVDETANKVNKEDYIDFEEIK